MIERFKETLKVEAHKLGDHGLDEQEFCSLGILRGAVESMRGEYIAEMGEKREFVKQILNLMQERGFIEKWQPAGSRNRYDYSVQLPNGRTAAIELKGCLDGNNTIIYKRPPQAHEFIVWSVCTSPGADPRHNAWSGIHVRLSEEIIDGEQQVDGVIIWDMKCGANSRPCPKLLGRPDRITKVSHYSLPPPCIYVLPATIPSPRNNPHPPPQALSDVAFLHAFHRCFQVDDEEVNYVDFEAHYEGNELMRKTTVRAAGKVIAESEPTAIRRK